MKYAVALETGRPLVVFVINTAKVTGDAVTIELFDGERSVTEIGPVAAMLLREFDRSRVTAESTNAADRAALLSLNRLQTNEGIWPFLLSFVTLNQSHSHWLVWELQPSSKTESLNGLLD